MRIRIAHWKTIQEPLPGCDEMFWGMIWQNTRRNGPLPVPRFEDPQVLLFLRRLATSTRSLALEGSSGGSCGVPTSLRSIARRCSYCGEGHNPVVEKGAQPSPLDYEYRISTDRHIENETSTWTLSNSIYLSIYLCSKERQCRRIEMRYVWPQGFVRGCPAT
jgi:hypothetical protein